MKSLVRVENAEGFSKDMTSSAFVNTDKVALAEYKRKKKQAQDFELMKAEINILKDELASIKKQLNLS
jgi:hypothetical protein